jgi:pimeloyl-ACP methyl ester carboxylesterase
VHEGAIRAYIAGASHVGLTPAALDGLVAPWLGDEGQAAFYRQIAQADERFTDEFVDLLSGLALAVPVVWGSQDSWIPVDRAHRLAGLIPGARLRIIDGAGHLIQLDQPAALAVTLTEWLVGQGTST